MLAALAVNKQFGLNKQRVSSQPQVIVVLTYQPSVEALQSSWSGCLHHSSQAAQTQQRQGAPLVVVEVVVEGIQN